jgi:hypothetical protein
MRDTVHTTECEVINNHAYVHADIPNTNTSACLAHIPTYLHSSAIVYTMPHYYAHSCEQAMCCTHRSVRSVELWASAAAMCCAPFAHMEFLQRLYVHECVRRRIQGTCVAHDARSHTHRRVRYPCAYACRLQEVPQLDVVLRLTKKSR